MSKLNFIDFAKNVLGKNVLQPWEEFLIKRMENTDLPRHMEFINPKTIRGDRWVFALRQMRACWIVGENTTYISPLYESVRRPTLIIDELIYYDDFLKKELDKIERAF